MQFMKQIFYSLFAILLISCGGNSAKVEDVAGKSATPKATAQVKQNAPQVTSKKVQPKVVTSAPAAAKANTGDYKAKNEGWLVNFEEAYAESKKTGKPIMANFTGSDWCGWCKRLDKSVFHQPGFDKWADKNVVLLEVDFPRRFRLPADVSAQNKSLQQSFGVRGFPTIWVFDAEKDASGKVNFNAMGKTGYTKTMAEFTGTIEKYISSAKG